MNCRQSEIVLEGKEGNGPKEIHDTRDFGALSVKNGHHCLVVAGKAHMPIAPQGPQRAQAK